MRVNPSFPPPGVGGARRAGRAGWLGFALITAMAVASCSKSNQSGNADAGDDDGGSDSGVFDTSLGDDVVLGDDVFIGDDSSSANCEIPDGLYMVTLTPASDAGDGGQGCTTTMTTLMWPPGVGGDGGTHCTLTPDGMTPSCTIDFFCTQRGATLTTTSQGYIEVYQTSYTGYETVTINENSVGMQQLQQCTYDMALTYQ